MIFKYFQGVRFEARGDGEYRLMVPVRSARDRIAFSARFTASAEWKEVRIPFSTLSRPASAAARVKWTRRDLLMLTFEIARPAGGEGWLELDNVRFW